MNTAVSSPPGLTPATRVRYGVLGFACSLSMITYLDRVCFGSVAPFIQKEFSLSDAEQGWLFTAFALAYAMFEVPTGWLGDVFGPRRTLIRIVLWWSLFTALTGLIFPVASLPWFAFVAMLTVRFLFGIGEAGAYPNLARALHNWFPFAERGSAQGAVWMAGRFAGGVTPLIVLSLLMTTQDAQGQSVVLWRHSFWCFGLLGVFWCVLFWWWFRDRPEQTPGVNAAELAWIRGQPVLPPIDLARAGEQLTAGWDTARAAAEAVEDVGRTQHVGEGEPPLPPVPTGAPPAAPAADGHSHAGVPWAKVLTNGNLWVLCLMYFCAAYGWYFNITWLPKFLRSEFHLTQGENWSPEFWRFSLLAGMPLLMGSLACLTGGLLTDAFIKRTGNRKWGRRLFGVVGHGACAGCYFLSMTAKDPWLFVLLVALAAFCNDLTMGAAWASCLDIGRKYSGIVSGCMNTVGNLGGAVAGIATGLVLDHFDDLHKAEGWRFNFYTYGAVYVVAVLLWLVFDSTRPIVHEEH
jgi:MFS family permease